MQEREPKSSRQPEQRVPSSFDVVASIRLIRHDLDKSDDFDGPIQPETMQRIYDEELSWVAEGIDRHSYTKFTLQRDERMGLVFFDQGEWKPYLGTLLRGMKVAEREAEEDPRRKFRIADVADDLATGYKMGALKPGESMQWDSPYPEAEEAVHGAKFIAELGYQPKRKMGFLYRAECHEDGSVTLESHTVDSSDPEAFAAVRALTDEYPDADMEDMLYAYDDALLLARGERYRAGRLVTEETPETNANEFIQKHKGLVEYYFDEVIALARKPLTLNELEQPKKELTYGFWARIKELLLQESQQMTSAPYEYRPASITAAPPREQLFLEVQQAFKFASLRGEVMPGCGGSIKGKSLSEMEPDEAFDAIFGDEMEYDKTDDEASTTMKCVNCPKCKTFHDEVKKIEGKFSCKNEDCGYEVSA